MSPSDSERPVVVFSHANSFPAATYALLFRQWRQAGYDVHAIDKYGHDPRYPVTTDWPHLVQQLHDTIRDDVGRPVFLVGHSLGGYLSMMLASRYPRWARGVVVLDSPLLHGWRAGSIALAKRLGLMSAVMPSRISAQRRHHWPNAQEAHGHFHGKPKFRALHPEVLQDYLRHGLEAPAPEAPHRLSFQREIETAIYNTMPHHLEQEFRRHPLQCPVAFIGGTRSSELRRVGLGGVRRLVGPNLSWIPGTHLYPLEHPQETAGEVLRWLRQFDPSPSTAP